MASHSVTFRSRSDHTVVESTAGYGWVPHNERMHHVLNNAPGCLQAVPYSDVSHGRIFRGSGATRRFVSIARLIELCEWEDYVR